MTRDRPLYRQICSAMTEAVRTGRLKPGERFPSEKELAEQFSVSRITSKKALESLANEGWIVRRIGVGSFVSDRLPSEPAPARRHGGAAAEAPAFAAEPGPAAAPLIGVVLQDWSPSYGLRLLSGIEEALAERGFGMLLRRSFGSQQAEETGIEFLLSLGIRGLIIYPVNGEYYGPVILRLHVNRFPIVLVDRYLPGIQTNAVYSDNVAGAEMAVRHLVELGHRRIALLSPSAQGTASVQDRITGFTQAHIDAGLPVDQSIWLATLPSQRPTATADDVLTDAAIADLLQASPDVTAIFAVEYSLAVRARTVAIGLGRRVPEELSIVCFDDPKEPTEHDAFFTHVRQAEREMGRQAAQLLVNCLEQGTTGQRIVLPTQLIEAQSTAPAPVRT